MTKLTPYTTIQAETLKHCDEIIAVLKKNEIEYKTRGFRFMMSFDEFIPFVFHMLKTEFPALSVKGFTSYKWNEETMSYDVEEFAGA